MSTSPPQKRARRMITIPQDLAAALGLKSGGSPTCELPEDELEGRMALAGLSSRSDVFNSPLLEGFVADAPDVFTAEVLSRLDDGDLAMLALVNQKMRKVEIANCSNGLNLISAHQIQ